MTQKKVKNDTFDNEKQKAALVATVKVILCIILLFAIPMILFNPNISLGIFDFFRHDFFKTEIILKGRTYDTDGLVKSIKRKDIKLINLYVRSGFDLNKLDSQGISPACVAAELGNTEVMSALMQGALNLFTINQSDKMTPAFCSIRSDNVKMFSTLLKSGISLNTKNDKVNGISFIHYAAALGKDAVLSYIVEQGADVNVIDMLGRTPLHFAATQNKITVLYVLLNAGAVVDVVDQNGETPMDVAKKYGHDKYIDIMERYSSTNAQQKPLPKKGITENKK